MTTVGGTFAVVGGAYREIELDTEDMTPEQIAQALWNQAERPSLCHQCTSECEDPELDELTSLTVDGREYVWDEGTKEWRPYQFPN